MNIQTFSHADSNKLCCRKLVSSNDPKSVFSGTSQPVPPADCSVGGNDCEPKARTELLFRQQTCTMGEGVRK